jgi:hypothetical protein
VDSRGLRTARKLRDGEMEAVHDFARTTKPLNSFAPADHRATRLSPWMAQHLAPPSRRGKHE